MERAKIAFTLQKKAHFGELFSPKTVDYLLACVSIKSNLKESIMSKFTTQQQVFLFLGELTVNPNVPASVQEDALALQTKMGDYASMQLPHMPSFEEFVAHLHGKAKWHPCATFNPQKLKYSHKD
jgi:hypothetical protein